MLALVLVGLTVALSSPDGRSLARIAASVLLSLAAGLAAAGLVAWILNDWLFELVSRLQGLVGHAGHDYLDPQGALRLMAPYQAGLFIAIWLGIRPRPGGRRLFAGLAVLALSQIIVVALTGEWASHFSAAPHVAAIRAWAVISVAGLAFWLFGPLAKPGTRRLEALPRIQHG
jgi:hypothetical protein